MENEIIESVAVGQSVASTDMSAWGLFMQADPIVQAVMLLLLAASFWSWAIIFDKLMKLRRLRAIADSFEEAFWSGGSLLHLYERVGVNPKDPMSAVFGAGMREWKLGSEGKAAMSETRTGSVLQRVDRAMRLTLGRELEALERHLTFLASVGSTAPFIGLFGTVWGIMNSFQSIAISKNTSLAVVAPGIAEALFATAMGLVAAIPAVVAYNKISNGLNGYANRIDGFSDEFSAILAREAEGTS
ncbi:MAG: protein TolQ [Rhodospirillaceae bacterium]|nr:MAG: protein TolQ [Rhodospirillaceae bacterium]